MCRCLGLNQCMNEKRTANSIGLIIGVLLIFFLQGCATVTKTDQAEVDPIDPHEDINRVAYDFTDKVDRVIFVPVVDAYVEYVPNAAQKSIGNFYDNLSYPNVVLNAFLQEKLNKGLLMVCVLRLIRL